MSLRSRTFDSIGEQPRMLNEMSGFVRTWVHLTAQCSPTSVPLPLVSFTPLLIRTSNIKNFLKRRWSERLVLISIAIGKCQRVYAPMRCKCIGMAAPAIKCVSHSTGYYFVNKVSHPKRTQFAFNNLHSCFAAAATVVVLVLLLGNAVNQTIEFIDRYYARLICGSR